MIDFTPAQAAPRIVLNLERPTVWDEVCQRMECYQFQAGATRPSEFIIRGAR